MNLQMTKLGEICEFINGDRGKNYPSGNDIVKEGVPFINAGHIQNNKINLEEMNYITEEKYNLLGSGKIKKGDIVYCLRGSLGKYGIISLEKGAIASSLVILRPNKCIVEPRFLMHYLGSTYIQKQIYKANNGSSQPNLSAQSVKNFDIYLPCLNIQIKIANILDQAQELIDKRKAQIEALDELIQSVFYEMFGDPVQNPFSFDQYKIKDLVIDDKYAIKAGPFGSALKKEYYVESGYKVYGQEQVIQGDLAYGDYYIDEDRYRMLEYCKIQWCDLLFSLVVTFGKMLVVPDNFQEGIINPRLMKISFDQSKILPQFFKSMFQNEAMIKYMNRNTHGATMGILNTTIIKELNVIVPSLEMQLDYLNRRMFIEKQKELLNESLVELENNFYSLMQRAFNGEPLC